MTDAFHDNNQDRYLAQTREEIMFLTKPSKKKAKNLLGYFTGETDYTNRRIIYSDYISGKISAEEVTAKLRPHIEKSIRYIAGVPK